MNGLALAASVHRRLVQRPRTKLLVRALLPLAEVAEPRALLDVGTGNGDVGRALASALGASFRGVDVAVSDRSPADVTRFDGVALPFERDAFDVVLLADVLHHAREPEALLSEALRVARRAVILKDHFAFGPISERVLLALDVAGNRPHGVDVLGRYFRPEQWWASFRSVGAKLDGLVWPLDVHRAPLRTLTRSELQFAARLIRRDHA